MFKQNSQDLAAGARAERERVSVNVHVTVALSSCLLINTTWTVRYIPYNNVWCTGKRKY